MGSKIRQATNDDASRNVSRNKPLTHLRVVLPAGWCSRPAAYRDSSAVGRALLNALDRVGLQTFGALADLKVHHSSLIQRAIAVALDGREMNEDILAAFAFDESVSLGRIEPLNCTLFFHVTDITFNVGLAICGYGNCGDYRGSTCNAEAHCRLRSGFEERSFGWSETRRNYNYKLQVVE